MMWYNIITNLEDAVWYLNHEECIETYNQIRDIERIINDQSYRLTNIKYYMEKIDRIKRKFY